MMTHTFEVATNTSRQDLHEAMLAAFSDYDIPMNLPFSHFNAMLDQRLFDPTLSKVAISKQRIDAFWLIGRNQNQGYLIASGTRPSARKTGLASALAKQCEILQHTNGIVRIQFEVLTTNSKAVSLYEKLGYQQHRNFDCYSLECKRLKQIESHTIVDRPWSNISLFASRLRDWHPAWQNSDRAIEVAGKTISCLANYENEQLIGYVAVDLETGRIFQLAVQTEHRRYGVASSLLKEAAALSAVSKLTFINIDGSCSNSKSHLSALGATVTVSQREMTKEL